jgi:hypothetical protein
MGIVTPEESKRYSLNKEDVYKWLRNIAIFSAPLVLLFLIEIQKGTDYKQALMFVYAALIQAAVDLLKKFISGSK